MTTERSPETGAVDASIARLALLADPTRAALHRTLRDHATGITRDEAAAAVGVSRSLVAFHLDRLVEAGLATVTYERRNGRTGPGAGRPAKIYHRSAETVAASVPERHYDLAAALFAQAITASTAGGLAVDDALAVAASDYGRALGEAARSHARGRPSRAAGLAAALAVLGDAGFEPEARAGSIVLRNCPFDALVRTNRDLVCGMNRSLMAGVIDGLRLTGIVASFEPRDGACCVVWRLA
jgi:predicted ArsR family transcriptional regulator